MKGIMWLFDFILASFAVTVVLASLGVDDAAQIAIAGVLAVDWAARMLVSTIKARVALIEDTERRRVEQR